MLKRFIPFAHAESIYKIDLDFFTKLGIKYVFADLDNTLDSYKQKIPLEPAKKLKEDLEKRGIELIIVSTVFPTGSGSLNSVFPVSSPGQERRKSLFPGASEVPRKNGSSSVQ